jgi:hypothetical protein
MSEFKIGEVARLVAWKHATWFPPTNSSPYFGTDVKVESPPIYSDNFVNGVGYMVASFDGNVFDVGAVCLRKIQPPPNWIKLCKLDEVPVDATPCRLDHVVEFS